MQVSIIVTHDSGGYVYDSQIHTPTKARQHPFAVLAITEVEGTEKGGTANWFFRSPAQIDDAIAELFSLRNALAAEVRRVESPPVEFDHVGFGEPAEVPAA